MSIAPAHGTNPVHGTVIDSRTGGHNNRPNGYPVAPPGRQDGPISPKTRRQIVASSPPDSYECDALVVGSGCAGMSAAVTAGHHGLNVLIVEKEPRFWRHHHAFRRLAMD